jgi:2,3-dihydroxyethylbenzene 1,2-dioxygenase
MREVNVTELGYIGIGARDVESWHTMLTEIYGLESADENGILRFRIDNWNSRIVLYPDSCEDLLFAGFRVAGPDELLAMRNVLEQQNIPYEVATSAEADQRRVLEYLRLRDPSGVPLEIFHGPQVDRHRPFRPGRGMHGKFRSGDGGLGHLLIKSHDNDASYRFYRDVMGMRGGREIRTRVGEHMIEGTFMHCNSREHTVVFGVPTEKHIGHLMLEVDNIDDVGLALDLVRQREIPIVADLGRHANDESISFYASTPSGWALEYGFGGSASRHQSEYNINEVWGHKFVDLL